MGIEEKYRTSSYKKEIIDSLIDIHIEASPVTIWQNDGNKRSVTKAKIEAIDFASESIILTPFSDMDTKVFYQLNTDATFYLKGSTRDIVFKQDRPAKRKTKSHLQIFIPKEVKLIEKRSDTRIIFKGSTPKVTAEIYPGGSIDISTKTINVDMIDVSLSGMGFFLDKKYSRFFFEKDKIKIDRIGKYCFSEPQIGTIVYTSKEDESALQVRIGVRFSEKITSEILARIKNQK